MGDLPEAPNHSPGRSIRAASLPCRWQHDHGWPTDLTYIPLQKGFLYLVASVDLFFRNVLSWKLSNSLDTEFCLDVLEMGLAADRKPENFHSDQGCQFTSGAFVARLQAE